MAEVKIEGEVFHVGVIDFLVVLDGDDWDRRLRFPRRFALGSSDVMPALARVRHSGGRERWTMVVHTESQEVMALTHGWKQFVDAHKIEPGFQLRLRWLGGGDFTIAVYDREMCRRDYPPHLFAE